MHTAAGDSELINLSRARTRRFKSGLGTGSADGPMTGLEALL